MKIVFARIIPAGRGLRNADFISEQSGERLFKFEGELFGRKTNHRLSRMMEKKTIAVAGQLEPTKKTNKKTGLKPLSAKPTVASVKV